MILNRTVLSGHSKEQLEKVLGPSLGCEHHKDRSSLNSKMVVQIPIENAICKTSFISENLYGEFSIFFTIPYQLSEIAFFAILNFMLGIREPLDSAGDRLNMRLTLVLALNKFSRFSLPGFA